MIPLFSLNLQNEFLGKELKQVMSEVIKKGNFILGEKVAEFEREFAKYLGVKYAVGVASGTDALSLGLLAVGVGRDDEVVLPANAYPTAFAVTAIGAMPRLVDIDPATFNIDPTKIPEALTKKTKAIIPVHLFGQPSDMEAILEIGEKYGIPIIEDCAQAHGATWCHSGKPKAHPESGGDPGQTRMTVRHLGGGIWKKVGSVGDVGCFSFYPTKNLGCFGDGGMVVTNNEEIYKKVKLLRMYGEESRYHSVLLGRNSRLDELQAAILLVKLKYLDKWNTRRRQIAQLYFTHFKENAPRANKMQLPFEASYAKHVYHLFVIRTKNRDQLKKYLEEKGIGTAIHYLIPIHLVPSMKFLGYKKGDFPESENAGQEILSLPMYPELEEPEIIKVVEEIIKFYSQ